MPEWSAVYILCNLVFEEWMVLVPASVAKTGTSPSCVNVFASSSSLDGSDGRAVDRHPDHHHWSSGNVRVLPLQENRLPVALSAQAAKVSFIGGNIDFRSLCDVTI